MPPQDTSSSHFLVLFSGGTIEIVDGAGLSALYETPLTSERIVLGKSIDQVFALAPPLFTEDEVRTIVGTLESDQAKAEGKGFVLLTLNRLRAQPDGE